MDRKQKRNKRKQDRKRRKAQRKTEVEPLLSREESTATALSDFLRSQRESPSENARTLYLDRTGNLCPDPIEQLGLVDAVPDAETIRRAYRTRLRESPPERDPDLARQLREARDRLLDPAAVLEREFCTVQVPDPQKWGLLEEEAPTPGPARIDAGARLAGQLALYVLIEDELRNPSVQTQQGMLFET